MLKPTEQEEKTFALFAFEVQMFQLLRNQSDFFTESHGRTFHEDQNFLQNGRPTALSGAREERP